MYEKHVIVGRVGRDPEMRYTPAGVPVTDFSVAVDKSYTNKDGERVEKTKWFKVICWRKLAETSAQYLRKGRPVLVEGDLEAEAYTDKAGAVVAKLVITAVSVQFLPGGTRETGDAADDVPAGPVIPAPEDDIPF